MARPVQLRYNDGNGEQVIGTYLTDDNLINDGMLKNSGSGEYSRLEVIGDKQLQENLETDYTNYGTAQNGESEPEILVYTYEASSGNFILRDRVFPEDAGTIKDDGSYRNDNLWGFQKWVGRKRVSGISRSNVTITDIVNALLPSGYTAKTPAGDTVPTIENYSYTGAVNGALRDLIRDYPIKIWFTAELDGNNDYIVKVQSKGFGGVIQTVTFDDERQTEGYKINGFEPEDKSNIINKVEVVGKANDGSKIQVIESDSTSISQHGERYIKRNVGYVEDSTQATNLANSILSPDPSPHAEMSIPFQEDNQLNGSVDILDNRYGIDAVYTIVKQRDFFTEGRTEVELGFEKNRTEKRRNANRDLDERNNQLFLSQQKDVGNQDAGTLANDDANAQVGGGETLKNPDVAGDTTLKGTRGAGTISSFIESFTDLNMDGNWETVTTWNAGTANYLFIAFNVNVSVFLDWRNGLGQTGEVAVRVENTTTGDFYPDTTGATFDNDPGVSSQNDLGLVNMNPSPTIPIPRNITGDTLEIQVKFEGYFEKEVNGGTAIDAQVNPIVLEELDHRHESDTMNANDHVHDVTHSDSGHGSSGTSEHVINGSTAEKNVDISTEDKTDR